ncbi:hypothetical protein G3570_00300 [Balneolaceae bacterium YR4-1]|uniref:Uncharacterized protein n=1 Tax=Halalkalibaculum roseum TaxID=2709311 RepID=A0A6M1SVS7_9BACT|nr:hypothetical protein [Halalkalibaculum roseum]NGP75054.1 hypothetical protein [Halalkalibaculum roseum]
MFLRICLFITCFLTLSSTGWAQSDESSGELSQKRSFFDIRNEGGNRYLKVLDELQSYETEDRMEQSMKSAVMTPIASFMAPNSVYDSLLSRVRHRFRSNDIKKAIEDEGIFDHERVRQELLERTSGQNLVMFNEHHYYPNHRILVESLLPRFAEAGFDYLALETLAPGADSLLNAGYPLTIESGFYLKDPHFANLIRTAKSLGFQFVAYENTDRTMDREEGQAANLYAATFGRDQSAKVLVLAGVDHILEVPTQRGKRWLGAVLKEDYDLDPFTINQHHLKYFKDMAEFTALVESTAFSDHVLTSVDMHLINNISPNNFGSDFTFKNTYGQRVQVSLFLADEKSEQFGYNQLIPYDSHLVDTGEMTSYSLPERDMHLVVYNKEGNVLEERSINR